MRAKVNRQGVPLLSGPKRKRPRLPDCKHDWRVTHGGEWDPVAQQWSGEYYEACSKCDRICGQSAAERRSELRGG